MSKLSFKPLTADRLADFESLFGENGACGGCWCMYWRVPPKVFKAKKGNGNRDAMRGLVRSGIEPGILAYDGSAAVGWCALAPREDYGALARSRILKPVDERECWSVSCFFIARGHRRTGVSTELLKAAARFAKSRGALVLEGYPVEPKAGNRIPDAFAWTGIPGAFLNAGFEEVERRSPTRPIMRLNL